VNDSKLAVIYTTPDRLFTGQVGLLDINDGVIRPVTNDTNVYSSFAMSATADARRLLAIQYELPAEINIVDLQDLGRPNLALKKLADVRNANNLSWDSPSTLLVTDQLGKLTLISETGERTDVNAPGFVAGGCVTQNAVVWFKLNESANGELWRAQRDGSNARKIMQDRVAFGRCSKDGKWVYVAVSNLQRNFTLKRVSLENDKVEDTGVISQGFVLSPDGKRLAYFLFTGQSAADYKNTLFILETGTWKKLGEYPINFQINGVDYAGDNETLYFSRRTAKSANIFRFKPGSTPEQVTHFNDTDLFGFALSPDGKRIALFRGRDIRDMVLISDTTK
jgi:hypothetical protein